MNFSFTESQSSAIAQVNVDGQEIMIRFRNNSDQEYTFVTDNEDQLVEFLQNPGTQSIGQMYHRWVKEQVLIATEALVAAW